jgi:predicted nucleic acid-binding Zn ribbon protein
MERLFAAIPSIVKGLEPNEDVAAAVVFAAWNQAAGEQISSRTKPLGFNDKRLIVAVEDETWRQSLQALAAQMLSKLNKSLGDGTVRYIEFRVANFEPGT